MITAMEVGQIAREVLRAFQHSWKAFLGIHIAANLSLAFVLFPIFTLLTGWLILASGTVALTDEDILFFALSPKGLAILAVLAALFLILLIYEFAFMFIYAFQASAGQSVTLTGIGRYLLVLAWPLFRLALRMVAQALLAAAPFLGAVAGIYFAFLTEFDINYYLFQRPPVFLWSSAASILLVLAMGWVLFRIFAGWIMALPLVLVDRQTPSQALKRSRALAAQMRRPVALTLLAWAGINAGLVAVAGGLLDLGVDIALLIAGESLKVMAYLVAGLLLLWSLTGLAISFFGNSALALLILRLYRRQFPESSGVSEERPAPGRLARSMKLSGATLAVLLPVAAVAAGIMLDRTFDSLKPRDDTLVIAHRGASIDAPDNTLAAMEEAIRQGADYLEIDVQETAQGNVVVIHDRDLMKVGGSPLRVWGTPLADLQRIDVGSWRDPAFSDQRVPTLQELLALVKGRTRVNIELKYYGQEQRFEELVVQIVEEMDMANQVVAMSLNPEGVRTLKALRPGWTVGLLSTVAIGDVTRLEADFFAVNGLFATRRFVRHAQARGYPVMAWTINDPVQMAAMMGIGVDGIITDLPNLAAKVRTQRAELEPHERLLLQFASQLRGRVGSEQ